MVVLPCSWYTCAEICGDMKSENWLLCHVHAFSYFGGVPRLLIPDNCKTATTANNRYETMLNRSSQELADHYGTAITDHSPTSALKAVTVRVSSESPCTYTVPSVPRMVTARPWLSTTVPAQFSW